MYCANVFVLFELNTLLNLCQEQNRVLVFIDCFVSFLDGYVKICQNKIQEILFFSFFKV